MSSLLLPIQTTGFTVRSSSGKLTGVEYANTSLKCQVPQARDVRGDVRGSYPHRAEHANARQLARRAELVDGRVRYAELRGDLADRQQSLQRRCSKRAATRCSESY